MILGSRIEILIFILQNLSPEVVRFMFDGQRVLKSDSPGSIGMVEGDTLEVMTLQEGGAT